LLAAIKYAEWQNNPDAAMHQTQDAGTDPAPLWHQTRRRAYLEAKMGKRAEEREEGGGKGEPQETFWFVLGRSNN